MEFKNAINELIKDNDMMFMSDNGKILSVNDEGAIIVNKKNKVITNEDFENEKWSELLTNKKTFIELIKLHNEYNDIQFQVKHKGQEEDDFESRTIKYYLNDLLIHLTENYSNSETALILQDIEIFTE